mmetsp:Transcript_17280/g.27004  ORF Transcript_17280/g.27004 Transcript_17280/m.27004 type:complete len:587 (-) Transcript_17280:63-1823(-)|eukprot:CAMPEP_0201523572 /NCGR_PEP_ID=MMETSP0161_2-20130828/20328_1 /ASSEMBLY_ACC=CAM_ASM_000251 /TAXON_ID=180227 /ORGANISM="Neoparamoeba aestuarina, Strain SoJaBio B1-5/56/2" /LENGTH=586 /DNA_ID=CAMNT_0047922735 /DNA_START=17 /DNA_END=1777 /DNA_ORIENTATION=+
MKAVALLVVLCLGLVAAKEMNVFNSINDTPKRWRLVGESHSTDFIKFTVQMYPQNIDMLKAELAGISNPKSPKYGKWWTKEQIADAVSPPVADHLAVAAWLSTHGMLHERHGDFFTVQGRSIDVAAMLKTTFYTFQDEETGGFVDRLVQYTIPDVLDDKVMMVAGLSGFPSNKNRHLKIHTEENTKKDDQRGKVCPEVIWQLYNMQYTPEVVEYDSSLCLAAFLNVPSYRPKDLTTFEGNTLLPDIQPENIVGHFFSTVPLDESQLDVEYGIGIAQNVSTWFWTASGWLYDFNTEFLAADTTPYVVSMSYGYPEDGQCDVGDCNGMSNEQYVDSVDNQYMQMGMKGTTIVVSSGDQGAPGDFDSDCSGRVEVLSSSFPAASQYVLSIGATMLTDSSAPGNFQSPYCQTTDCATSRTEKPCSYPDALITTGGGFALYVPQPSYQTTEVANYLSSGVPLPASNQYDPTKRAYPDVTAVGHNFYIEYIGAEVLVDGTSCSAPVWGGIMSRLNAARLNMTKSVLGFVNPLFYSMFESDPTFFNDITTGNNNCTESCCGVGYTATTGWDPVSGMGSPNYPKILDYIQNDLN